jgi:hypothetical protein
MHRKLTDSAQRAVDRIMSNMQEYLDLRYLMISRANPRLETVWPDLAWQHMRQLRNTLSNDKMWGPNRYVIGEVLVSDDAQKVRDIWTPTNQNSIQTEVVEKTEKIQHKTSDVLDVHDFRTLYGSLDPSIATVVGAIQCYMWWDLPDACDLAKFDFKAEIVRKVVAEGASAPMKEFYARQLKMDDGHLPSAEDITLCELRRMRACVDRFTERRNGEPGYQMIVARKPTDGDDSVDRLVSAIARELVLLRTIESGQPIDDAVKQQFAQALRVDPASLSTAMEVDYLHKMLADHRRRLRHMMTSGGAAGEAYAYKEAQAEAIRHKLEELAGGRDISDPKPEPQNN